MNSPMTAVLRVPLIDDIEYQLPTADLYTQRWNIHSVIPYRDGTFIASSHTVPRVIHWTIYSYLYCSLCWNQVAIIQTGRESCSNGSQCQKQIKVSSGVFFDEVAGISSFSIPDRGPVVDVSSSLKAAWWL